MLGAKATVPGRSVTIRPPGRLLSVDWGELWRYRDLFLVLAWRDISVRYKQTALGFTWALLQPLISMVVFTFIFSKVANVKTADGSPYPLFQYVGSVFWIFYSNILNHSGNSMVMNASIIQKVYFPRLIVPSTGATTSLVDFLVGLVVLTGLLAYFRTVPHAIALVVLPVAVAITILSGLGLGLFLAALNIKYRDVRHALPFLIQIMMYILPVSIPLERIQQASPRLATLLLWGHPMTGVMTAARAAVYGQASVDWQFLLIPLVVSVITLAFGLAYFRATERYFADIV